MAADTDLSRLIQIMNPYTNPKEGKTTKMEFGHLAPLSGADAAATGSDMNVEIDNYNGEWSFRGNIQQIKRSLRITYRYPILNAAGAETGLYATEHLLIGYAGGNS